MSLFVLCAVAEQFLAHNYYVSSEEQERKWLQSIRVLFNACDFAAGKVSRSAEGRYLLWA